MSSSTVGSISDNFPLWLHNKQSDWLAYHPGIDSTLSVNAIAQEILRELPLHLQEGADSNKSFSDRLEQSLNFLDMYQTDDEKRFIERVQAKTPHNDIFEALPALHLMVLATNASVYPPRVGHTALLELLGPNREEFFELQRSLLVPSLDTVSPRIVEMLYRMAQNQSLVLEISHWLEGQRLFSFLDATSFRTLLDEIPSHISPNTWDGYKEALSFLRSRLSSFEIPIEELDLDDLDYPNVVVEGLPKEISLFKDLKSLNILSRDIHTLPPSIAQCHELRVIYFYCAATNNYLPKELGYLPKLSGVFVRENIVIPNPGEDQNYRHYKVIKMSER